jgi:hypothetical protein
MGQSQGGKAVSDEHYCPRCNAPFLCFNGVNTRHFKCGSSTQIPSVACKYASQLQERIKRLEKDSERLEKDSERLAWLLQTGLAWRGCYNDHWIEGEWLYASESAIEIIDESKEAK